VFSSITQETAATDSLTAQLAEYVLGLRTTEIPPEIRERAALLLLDDIAAGVLGSTAPGATVVHDEARARYRAGRVPVWGRATQLTPTGAALVNATQAQPSSSTTITPGRSSTPAPSSSPPPSRCSIASTPSTTCSARWSSATT
jgi:hypothetical protein